ncbi:MAG: hypothetical protein AAF556_09860, partial [Pseudomonadota bacterium]
YRSVCESGNCEVILQLYPHHMLPEGDYPDVVNTTVTMRDVSGAELAVIERALDIPVRLTGFMPGNKFEDFNLMLEPDRAIVEPQAGYRERVGSFLMQIADDNGWREIELLQLAASNGFWVIGYTGQLTYFGVLAIDKSGVWENKVELVDLQRDWPVGEFGGQCRR